MLTRVFRLYYHQKPSLHFFASTAEFYRACAEIGAVWQDIGKSVGRADVSAHGAELLKLAPLLYHDLHVSLNRTVNTTASPGNRCYAHRTEGLDADAQGQMGAEYRSFPELFFSGALTEQQADDMYKSGMGANSSCPIKWWMSMGSPSAGVAIFNHVPFGFPHGLLHHDKVCLPAVCLLCVCLPCSVRLCALLCAAGLLLARLLLRSRSSCCTSSRSRLTRARAASG